MAHKSVLPSSGGCVPTVPPPQEREVGARGPLEQHHRRLGPPVSGPWSSRGGGGEVRQADSKLKFQKISRLREEPGVSVCILYSFALIS